MAGSTKKTPQRLTIPLTKPHLGKEETLAAGAVIRSGWVTQGPKVAAFEKKFAQYVGAQDAAAVANCTVALHLSLLTAGVQPGNVVITVSHSFIATANCVRHCFAEPVFVDIDDNYNMSPQKLEGFLQKDCESKDGKLFYKNVSDLMVGESPLRFLCGAEKTAASLGRVAAILVVHQMGIPADMKAILNIAGRYSLPVIEDAACAIGSAISMNGSQWEKIGQPHGDIACFSFHPRKILTTGDGGMITANNKSFIEKIRLLRHQGMSVSDRARHEAKKFLIEEYLTTAYNDRLTDIQAAVGIEQLKKVPAMITRRRKIADFYKKGLKNISWLKPFQEKDFHKTNWQSFPVRLSEDAPLDRDGVIQHLLDNGVASRPGIMNSHQERPYSSKRWHLPESEKARDLTVLLPMFHSLSQGQCVHIINILKKIQA